MAATGREIIWGSPTAPRVEVIGGFAVLVLITLITTVATNGLGTDHPVRRFFYDVGLPVILFYAPGAAAAVGAYLRCGAVTCLVVGLIPAAFFVVVAVVGSTVGAPGVGGGDAPLWSITLAFATISMITAGVGFVVGVVVGTVGR
ncbi:hypothetical protein [Natrialbaceae archaeon AArc-T1-2]|uniref:hypothetical protein n=1 Tax=Natrialbaceae archaeon AArc-T1-2 TaxID=3053904 RepID=UPI00255AC86E|nr:hypothetical protein [Natrialbaceae archaeon AArc-T1-2]WIV67601.1 hypothetical protein QQ977_02395 [Natrialbaceae archaeon AArc-T1-2]